MKEPSSKDVLAIDGADFDLEHRHAQISMLKYDLEKIREQKDKIQLSVDTLEYTSKGVQKIIEAQLVNKAK